MPRKRGTANPVPWMNMAMLGVECQQVTDIIRLDSASAWGPPTGQRAGAEVQAGDRPVTLNGLYQF